MGDRGVRTPVDVVDQGQWFGSEVTLPLPFSLFFNFRMFVNPWGSGFRLRTVGPVSEDDN